MGGHLLPGIPSLVPPSWLYISRKSTAERSCSQQSMLDPSPLSKDCELAKSASLFYSDPFDCASYCL